MTTLENLKIGGIITIKMFKNDECFGTKIWKITNITAKNVMYSDGTTNKFQYKTMAIQRRSIKSLLDYINNGYRHENAYHVCKYK